MSEITPLLATEAALSVGVRIPESLFAGPRERLAETLARLDTEEVSHVSIGDHVSFRDGTGYDGLVRATALLAMTTRVRVHVEVYLLALRHPVLAARQVATIAQLAPGRFVLGVGVGGDDPREYEVCGVPPSARGRRTNESLEALQALLGGGATSHHGRFFEFDDARIEPTPQPRVPIMIGGRSDRALERAGTFGDGWLGVWVSPERFAAAVGQIAATAEERRRGEVEWRHSMTVWCGFAEDRASAREHVASSMQGLYHRSFDEFERWTPYGTPADVADFVHPYAAAGCSSITLIPCGQTPEAAVEGALACARLLTKPGDPLVPRPTKQSHHPTKGVS